MTEPLTQGTRPADSNGNPEERRKERDLGHAIIVVIDLVKGINWAKIGMGFLILLVLSGHPMAQKLLSAMPGFEFLKPPKAEASLLVDIPVSETWKISVDRQLKELQRQNKIIIKLLTEQ